jgi:hypothetical protein
MYDLRNRFLKKKNPGEKKGIYPVSRYKEARVAAQNENYDAFQEWKVKFVEDRKDRSREGFKSFLGSLDPIASKLSDEDEMEFEQQFLTSEQREKLQVARQYSAELRDTLLAWWDATEENSMTEEIGSGLAFSIAKITKPNAEQIKDINSRVARLKGMGIDKSRLNQLLSDKLRKQGMKAEGRRRWIRDLQRRINVNNGLK